jgi:hypothetical protein
MLVGSGPVLAASVEQRLTDVFIYGVRTVEADCVSLLNLNDKLAMQALHAKQEPRNFAKPAPVE